MITRVTLILLSCASFYTFTNQGTDDLRIAPSQRAVEIYSSYYTSLSDGDITTLSNSIPANGSVITINQPGKYCLKNNLIFTPQNDNVTGILIATNNVVLDLKGYAISQGNNTANFSLISVATGHTNITISNGTLANCTSVACEILTGTKITLDNLSITNCKTTGIQLANCNNSFISNIYVTGCTTSISAELAGILLDSCTNIKITESTSNNHVSSTTNGLVDGFKFISCNDCTISNCNSNTHQAKRAYGYLIQNSSTCVFKNCKANHNIATQIVDTNGVAGFSLISSNNCRLENCQALSNSSHNFAYGFKLLNCQYNKLSNCEAAYNKTSCNANHYHTYGFYSTHDDSLNGGNSLIDCRATGNQGGPCVNSMGIGLALDGEKFSSITTCIAEYNHSLAGTGCGIYLNNSMYCTMKGNRLIANTGNSSTGGYGIWDAALASNNVYTENFAFANGRNDNTVVNNYNVALAPNGDFTIFPSIIAYLNNFTNLVLPGVQNYNIEIIERPL
ncbi:MAG TPA: right-handed parallel beta-helix repeat-containing protein [Candidatus Babeliales bacterium]|nr:right-handed parallel beta-helix repeat-containing protein [Candidatus Babeliales bacterium]